MFSFRKPRRRPVFAKPRAYENRVGRSVSVIGGEGDALMGAACVRSRSSLNKLSFYALRHIACFINFVDSRYQGIFLLASSLPLLFQTT